MWPTLKLKTNWKSLKGVVTNARSEHPITKGQTKLWNMARHLSTYHSADYYHFNTPKKACIVYVCDYASVFFFNLSDPLMTTPSFPRHKFG